MPNDGVLKSFMSNYSDFMAWFKFKGKSQKTLFGPKKTQPEAEYKKPTPPGKKKGSNNLIFGLIALVVIIAIAYYASSSSIGQPAVALPATINLTGKGTLFSIGSDQYLISLANISSGGKAYVRVTKLPVFFNPMLNVTLLLGNITKVNAGSGTQYANVGIQLQSMSKGSATVKLTQILTSLQIAPDSQNIRTVQGILYTYGQSTTSSIPASSTTITGTTSTISGASSSTSSTVPTTTLQPTNTTLVAINATLRLKDRKSTRLNSSHRL